MNIYRATLNHLHFSVIAKDCNHVYFLLTGKDEKHFNDNDTVCDISNDNGDISIQKIREMT